MLKLAVCVSGGGSNLQAIIDAIDSKAITNAEISVVISNNANAYALERAKKHGIESVCISQENISVSHVSNRFHLQMTQANTWPQNIDASCH